MPELIEKGHLYVAQPPLYRVASGNKEFYIKEEEGLNQYLLERIAEKEKVILENGDELTGKKLIRVLGGLIKFYESLNKLSRRGHSARFIEFLVMQDVKDKNLFRSKEFMDDLIKKLESNGFQVADIHWDEEEGFYEFLVTETMNGGQSSAVNWGFLSSPELRQLMSISEEYRLLKQGSYTVDADGQRKKIEDPQELLQKLMEKAKKGLNVQRYKGLGEMNPDQLWSTTMDPARRTLLRVEVKDGVEADAIFNVLMGDKVDPRREFIQANALEVTELDI
jgi:DNA gyrase subunit B